MQKTEGLFRPGCEMRPLACEATTLTIRLHASALQRRFFVAMEMLLVLYISVRLVTPDANKHVMYGFCKMVYCKQLNSDMTLTYLVLPSAGQNTTQCDIEIVSRTATGRRAVWYGESS